MDMRIAPKYATLLINLSLVFFTEIQYFLFCIRLHNVIKQDMVNNDLQLRMNNRYASSRTKAPNGHRNKQHPYQ